MSAEARLEAVRSAVVEQPSRRWTTRMVQRLLAAKGFGSVDRFTARGYLTVLVEQKLLAACGPENGRYYTFNFWSEGAR